MADAHSFVYDMVQKGFSLEINCGITNKMHAFENLTEMCHITSPLDIFYPLKYVNSSPQSVKIPKWMARHVVVHFCVNIRKHKAQHIIHALAHHLIPSIDFLCAWYASLKCFRTINIIVTVRRAPPYKETPELRTPL